jgi:hypothetical protein
LFQPREPVAEFCRSAAQGTGIMDIEARFWELCDRATRHDDAAYRKLCDDSAAPEEAEREARVSEHAMVAIIHLVENHPEHRPTSVRCFCDLVLWKRPAPFLLVAFCMRRLRFPEIPELIARDAKEHQGTAYYTAHMNYWSAINHAYLDENALGFDFYRHEGSADESKRRTKPGT